MTPTERAVILEEVRKRDPEAIVYLFGSRQDDSARGGDIDLLIESGTITFSEKISILAGVKGRIGDQKIDMLITKDRFRDSDPFIRSINDQLCLLSIEGEEI